jgi:twinkle protein
MTTEFTAGEKAELKSYAHNRAPGHYRRTCPACSPSRRNSKAACLSMTIYPEHLVASCHHCEASGAVRLVDNPYQSLSRPFNPPAPEPAAPKKSAVKRLDKALGGEAKAFLSLRGISEETASTFSCVSARAWFRELGEEGEAVAYPYMIKGKAMGHKVRCTSVKDFVVDRPLSSLFGLDCVDLAESPDLLICEGELDPLSFYEAKGIECHLRAQWF